MEPDSDDELVQEIQSVLETTEPHAKNSVAAPSSPSSSSTSLDSSSSSSGEDVEGSGPGPQRHATAPETGPTSAVGEGGRVPPAGSSSRRPATFTSTESSGYHVSTSNPVEVAATLGMPEAKGLRLRFSPRAPWLPGQIGSPGRVRHRCLAPWHCTLKPVRASAVERRP